MQPQPLSEENPVESESVFLILTDNENVEAALGSTDLGIGSNPDLYVIQNLDAMSSKNPGGHPLSESDSSSAAADELLDVEAGGVSSAFADVFDGDGGLGDVDDGPTPSAPFVSDASSWPAGVVLLFTGLELGDLASSTV